jgi:hypothetical protein
MNNNNNNLEKAIKILEEEKDLTLVLVLNEDIYKSSEKGIKSLLQLLNSGKNYLNYSAADKIVGKAAAMLYKLLNVNDIYGEVMSIKAINFLEQNNINFKYKIKTNEIINRKGTGICPMEQTVLNIENPTEAKKLLENKLKELKIKNK